MTQGEENPVSSTLSAANPSAVPLLLFVAVAGLIGTDVVADFLESGDPLHLSLELAVTGLALAGAALSWRSWQRERRASREALDRARTRARVATEEATRWRREAEQALRGLGAAIDAQFARWELTEAEAEVALLLLKGLSHKEVAQMRDTSERTAREQGRAVYRKSGLTGRADLAAFFLEDLLLPRASGTAPGSASEARSSDDSRK